MQFPLRNIPNFCTLFTPIIYYFQCIFSTISAQLIQSQQICANSGRFMQAYCLADFNCNFGRQFDRMDPTQRQICIRGWCCSQTTTPKEQVNVFLQQDQLCPSGTFNVELQCQTNEDCIRSSGISRIPFPILECGGRGYCCTSRRYQKPLRRGDYCLNGGIASGIQCQRTEQCQQQQIGRINNAVCIDNQCCSRRSNAGQFDHSNSNWNNHQNGIFSSDILCSNGGHFTNQYCSGLVANECGNLYQMAWTAICIDGRCCTTPLNAQNRGLNDFDRGKVICLGYRLQYIHRHCQSPSNCGYPSTDFTCISGYCCTQYGVGGNWNSWNAPSPGIRPKGPNGFCLANGQFSRFMGHSCTVDSDCPSDFDSRTQAQLMVKCIQNWCCAANSEFGTGTGALDQGGNWISPNQNPSNGLIPIRNVQGFCFDGSQSDRQCLDGKDCRAQEGCINNVCCQNRGDQDQYACGGLQAIGRCTSNGYCIRGECVSANVCCECQYGQPQLNIANCRNGDCHQGYVCNQNGFCCPQCPGGALPYGSCYLGRCTPGFSCRPGNICCEDGPNELAIGIGGNGNRLF